MKEIRFRVSCGTVRGLAHIKGGKPLLLCLHGWLDNAASFLPLSPFLTDGYDMVALDLPGHGKSDHYPKARYYHFADYLITVREILHQLKAPSVHFLGHSMGAGIFSLYSGAHPDSHSTLILIEGLGPLSNSPAETPGVLSDSISKILKETANARPEKVFKELSTGIALRMKAGLQREAASLLVRRGSRKSADGYSWRRDRRLLLPSLVHLTEEQVLSFLGGITVPTLLVLGSSGFEEYKKIMEPRHESIRQLKTVRLQGGHHLHMENPQPVAEAITSFLSQAGF